jgi:hypothetical protein
LSESHAAAAAYGKLLAIWHAADVDLPALAEAEAYLEIHPHD